MSQIRSSGSRLRWGLCCQFAEEPISFRSTTATSLLRLTLRDRREKLSRLCLDNARSLLEALRFCSANAIGCFRILSSLLPAKTHPLAGYEIADLPDAGLIVSALRECNAHARSHNLRMAFHPDQYVVLNSPRPDVVAKSIQELEYHAELAELVGADVINIHAGGAYGDKRAALEVLRENLERLSDSVRSRLTLENDDKVYTPRDLLPLCQETGVPLVYDVHHHRCLPDDWSVQQATQDAQATWNREPLLHISSPREGWNGPQPYRHHDYIDPVDFPPCWLGLSATVEIEAKAKELALFRLRDSLQKFPAGMWQPTEQMEAAP